MNPLWVVQSNLGSEAERDNLVSALRRQNVAHQLVKAIPFSDEPPDIEWDGPVLFYGATNFVNTAWRSKRWTPCAFFDPELFRYDTYLRIYSGTMLNRNAILSTIGRLADSGTDQDAMLFIRPLSDLKDFPGEVMRFGDFHKWAQEVAKGGLSIDNSTRIVIAPPKNIGTEWRVFIANGKAVAATQYRMGGRLHPSADVPDYALLFAEAQAGIWSPAPVYVMDVAHMNQGESNEGLAIIELGCINSAGLYAADADAIVEAVTALL